MKVTIEKCLEVPALEGAEIVSGNEKIKRGIKKVSVLETTDLEELKKYYKDDSQLILTTFSDIKDDIEKQCEIVDLLAKNKNSGLIILRVGEVLPVVDVRVIEQARKNEFPLIVSHKNFEAMGDLINEISARMFYGDKENFQNKLITNSIFHLLNFEKYDNFQMALRETAIANNFQVVIVSRDFNPIFSVETRKKVGIEEAVSAWKNNGNALGEGVYFAKSIKGILTYWGPISINGENLFLLLVDNNDKYTTDEITKLAEIIEISALMWKYTPESDTKAEIIKALRRGNRSLAHTLNKEVNIEDNSILSTFVIKTIDKNKIEELLNKFIEKNPSFEIMRVDGREDSYGILISKGKKSNKKREEERFACVELYNFLAKNSDMRIFHVLGTKGIEGAIDAFQIINETDHFVERIYSHRNVFSKFELALARNCIGIEIQGGAVRKTFLEFLEPLSEVGELKEKQLLETLETFILDTGTNNNLTAELMGVHANTIQYRLKRIEDLLGVEILTDGIVPSLTIALALKRLSKDHQA